MSVWAEFKRRNVFKVGAAYAILAWLIAQAASLVAPNLALPDWIVRFVVLTLILGFPLALFLAWAYELTPEGIKRTRQVPLSESIRHLTGQKLNYVVTGLLVLAVASIAVDTYVLRRPGPPGGRLPSSVAVLPFENLSTDPDHASFAFGIHEEILNQLAKVRSLRVTSRTSVVRYASDRPSIPEIAKALNVGAVIEGSVRYAGNRIQVTVQLIDAATDSHMWSDTYPGDLSDLSTLFALQADIAMNVANALRAELTPAELASIEQPPTDSPEAYELYFAAGDASRGSGLEDLTRALELIEEAIELDRDFAPAWVRKSDIHSAFVNAGPLARAAEEQVAAEEAVRHAIALDDDWAEAYGTLGYALSQRSKPVEAELAYRKATDLGVVNPSYGILLMSAGNFTKAREVHERSRERDPLNPTNRMFLLVAHGLGGNIEAAREEYERGRAVYGDWGIGDAFMMWLLLGRGDTAAALDILARRPIGPGAMIDAAVRENFDTPSAALAKLREQRADPANENPAALITIAMWAASFGDEELALEVMDEMVAANSQAVYLFWYPQMREVRRLPGFKEVMREAGFVDYWNEFGWPEACRRTAGEDFECE